MSKVSSVTLLGYWIIGFALITLLVGGFNLQSTRKLIQDSRGGITPWGIRKIAIPPLTPFPPEKPLDLYRKWLPDYFNKTEGPFKSEDKDFTYKVVSSDSPRALLLIDFITKSEAKLLMSLADGKLTRSQVVSHSGGGRVGSVRTSEGTFLTNADTGLRVIRRRVAAIANVPVGHLERTQILRYESGQYYRLHPDFFSGSKLRRLGKGGQRMATVIIWLTDVTSGGETVFSNAEPVLSLSPKPLSAVLFYSLDRRGSEDKTSMHQSLPVSDDAIKWVAVFWIRIGFMN